MDAYGRAKQGQAEFHCGGMSMGVLPNATKTSRGKVARNHSWLGPPEGRAAKWGARGCPGGLSQVLGGGYKPVAQA